MTAAGMHDSNVTSEKLLRLCKMLVLPAATHKINSTSQSDTVQERCDKLEAAILRKAFRMLTSTRWVRLKVIAGLERLDQVKGTATTNMIKRIMAIADALPNKKRAQGDIKRLDITQRKLRLPLRWIRKRIKDGSKEYKQNLKQSSPRCRGHNANPALQVENRSVARA